MPDLTPAWLLDKNVVRRAIEGIGASLVAVPLSTEQGLAIRLLRRGIRTDISMMIAPETANILSRRSDVLEVRIFFEGVSVMRRARYFKRWARRLREHGFTREDAKTLSYGTFGLDPTELVLGASVIITFDRPFINNFKRHQEVLTRRLKAMTVQLQAPYRNARLPEIATPEHVLRVSRRVS